MLRLAEQRDRLQVVDDQLGCPTYAPDIAGAIIAIARQVTGSRWNPGFAGVTHLAGPDVLSWCGFAKEIVRGAVERGGRSVPVDPISTSDYPTAALRPAGFTWLDTGTPDSLLDAGEFVATLERRQGIRIACPEEVAFGQGFIDRAQLERLGLALGKSDYARYVTSVALER